MPAKIEIDPNAVALGMIPNSLVQKNTHTLPHEISIFRNQEQ